MNRCLRPLSLLTVVAVTGACNGFAPLRLAEVETRNGDNATVKEITYGDDGRVEEIETRSNGDFVSRLAFIWDGGTLAELVYERDNSQDIDITLTYEGGLLVAMNAEDDDNEYELDISYVNDDARLIDEHTFVIQAKGGGRQTVERSHEYEDGRIVGGAEQTTLASGGGSLTFTDELELTWGDDGLPAEAELTSKAFGQTATRDVEYKYRDDGRIEEADYDDGDNVSVSYDDQGRMEEVEVVSDGDRVVHELSYEDGTHSGFVFVAPGLPANVIFDLTGKAFTHPEIFSDAYLPVP